MKLMTYFKAYERLGVILDEHYNEVSPYVKMSEIELNQALRQYGAIRYGLIKKLEKIDADNKVLKELYKGIKKEN